MPKAVKYAKEVIADLRNQVMKIYNSIYSVGQYTSRITKGTKCALSTMNICNDYMAPPLNRFNPAERKQIEKLKDKSNVISSESSHF